MPDRLYGDFGDSKFDASRIFKGNTMSKSVFGLLLLAGALCAQDFRATLTGTVTDPTGAAIPDATVKATNVATNAVKEVKTTSDGLYTIPYLDPGTYNVEIAASGF